MEACRYLLVIDTAWMDEWMDKQMKGNRRERTRSVDPDTRTEGGGREDNEGWGGGSDSNHRLFLPEGPSMLLCHYRE